jgi:hypothetical protein
LTFLKVGMYCIKKENNNNQRYFFDEKIKNRNLLKIKNNVIIHGKKSPRSLFPRASPNIRKINRNIIFLFILFTVITQNILLSAESIVRKTL